MKAYITINGFIKAIKDRQNACRLNAAEADKRFERLLDNVALNSPRLETNNLLPVELAKRLVSDIELGDQFDDYFYNDN